MTLVRDARREDLKFVVQLVQELAEFEKQPDAVKTKLEEYETNFDDGVFSCKVAESADGTIVGIALYSITFSTWSGKMVYLEDLVVSESCRRAGVGTLLMQAVVAEAKKRRCRRVKWQVLEWNDTAIAFYEKLGATLDKPWYNCNLFDIDVE